MIAYAAFGARPIPYAFARAGLSRFSSADQRMRLGVGFRQFRFAFKWSDPKSGEPRTRAGMQSYRIEAGKLAETWLMLRPLGSAWTDAVAQEHWTSPPPIR